MKTAVINEGIRLMFGVTTRLPRVSPTEPLTYKDWTIPAGVCDADHLHSRVRQEADTDIQSMSDTRERVKLFRPYGQCYFSSARIV